MGSFVEAVDGIVHKPTQTRDDGGVDITVSEIYNIQQPGQLDFGGSEIKPADVQSHSKQLHNESDTYQWWHLDEGTYLIEYNESLSTEAHLQPRTEMLEQGVTHPSIRVESLPMIPLSVPSTGIHIKENARVSVIFPIA